MVEVCKVRSFQDYTVFGCASFSAKCYQDAASCHWRLHPTPTAPTPPLPSAGETVLALPKLNLQFLTIQDYLMRNFNLFRCGSPGRLR